MTATRTMKEGAMNDIPEKQLRTAMLSLIRARTLVYRRAKLCQSVVIAITLLLPVMAATAAVLMPSARAAIATAAVLIAVFDATFIDRWMKARLKEGAKLQEQFDCEVLDIHWNEFLTGVPVDAEAVYENGHKKLSDFDELRLRDWYPTVVATAPIEVARLICQRENLLYDSSIRVSYRCLLLWAVVVYVAAVVMLSAITSLDFSNVVLTYFVPAAPALIWAIRESNRQSDTVDTLSRLKVESEKLLKAAIQGITPHDARTRSRELQDAIYNHRVSSTLVFEWLYNFLRPRLESRLIHGAEHWVNEFKKSAP